MAFPTTNSTDPVPCAVLVSDVPLASAAPAVQVHRDTRDVGGVLFASDNGGARTVVVTHAPLRLVVRGDSARVTARADEGVPLLAALAERLPGAVVDDRTLCVEVPRSCAVRAAVDRDVLRGPSLFDPVRALAGLVADRNEAGLPPGLFGAFGADLVDRFEELGPRKPHPFDDADLELVFALGTACYDADRAAVRVLTRGLPWEAMAVVRARHDRTLAMVRASGAAYPAGLRAAPAAEAARAERPDEEFLDQVATLRRHIAAGDVFQAVLSRAVRWRSDADPLDVFVRLGQRERTPYAFHLELERGALFGASPETCVRVHRNQQVELRPIAGTTERGADADADARLALALLFDDKERAEHVMLLDLARNDVARVCVPGTMTVVQQFAVERYRRVQHLVSRVRGTLRPELDALHVYRAVANMGTLTGAPKPRAIELVRALEPTGRGFYGGAVGYLLADGSFDSCIAIRSVRAVDGTYRAQAGAGVVFRSNPQRELDETERKLRALREVMEVPA